MLRPLHLWNSIIKAHILMRRFNPSHISRFSSIMKALGLTSAMVLIWTQRNQQVSQQIVMAILFWRSSIKILRSGWMVVTKLRINMMRLTKIYKMKKKIIDFLKQDLYFYFCYWFLETSLSYIKRNDDLIDLKNRNELNH